MFQWTTLMSPKLQNRNRKNSSLSKTHLEYDLTLARWFQKLLDFYLRSLNILVFLNCGPCTDIPYLYFSQVEHGSNWFFQTDFVQQQQLSWKLLSIFSTVSEQFCSFHEIHYLQYTRLTILLIFFLHTRYPKISTVRFLCLYNLFMHFRTALLTK